VSLPLVLIYTTQKQAIVSSTPELHFGGEAWTLRGMLAYQDLPTSLFGIGNDTPEDSEEELTLEIAELSGTLLGTILGAVRAGVGATVAKSTLLEAEGGGVAEQWDERGLASGIRQQRGGSRNPASPDPFHQRPPRC